jgi:GNAT superfamily N-acetyltransferase
MPLQFTDILESDLGTLQALHADAAAALTARHGEGRWSRDGFGNRIDVKPGRTRIRVGRLDGAVVCSLKLQAKKPWAIDVSYFTPAAKVLYLTGMAVAPALWGQGIGRAALLDAARVAEEWGAGALRLDAYDAPAGAGPFYARCGWQERGRVVYRGNPLVYYESMMEDGG